MVWLDKCFAVHACKYFWKMRRGGGTLFFVIEGAAGCCESANSGGMAVTPRGRYWSRHMMPKLLGGALICAGILVLLFTQIVMPRFAMYGWWVGLGLVLLGGVMIVDRQSGV
jgi:hypothetical protein